MIWARSYARGLYSRIVQSLKYKSCIRFGAYSARYKAKHHLFLFNI